MDLIDSCRTTKQILKVGLPEPIVKRGDFLTIHVQIGLAATGRKLWSSKELGNPITFQVGTNELFRGLDSGCLGMTCREQRRLHVPAAEAFATAALPAWGASKRYGKSALKDTICCFDVYFGLFNGLNAPKCFAAYFCTITCPITDD
ncbi:unnamed protein product [Durusdinium trenchii]|uniref:peptidylprolyl isomerase n=1 Tax=Durusdinium trenchii TaxID=1381693 RepID=A0ABP0MW64_9DINO